MGGLYVVLPSKVPNATQGRRGQTIRHCPRDDELLIPTFEPAESPSKKAGQYDGHAQQRRRDTDAKILRSWVRKGPLEKIVLAILRAPAQRITHQAYYNKSSAKTALRTTNTSSSALNEASSARGKRKSIATTRLTITRHIALGRTDPDVGITSINDSVVFLGVE